MSTRLDAVRLYAVLAGACDFSTGLLLLAAPDLVLGLLGLAPAAEPIFVRWIGVFVAQVGLAYFYPWWRRAPSREAASSTVIFEAIFELTAVVRLAVAAFLAGAIASGALSVAWMSVLATDLTLALVQGLWLRRGLDSAGSPVHATAELGDLET